MPHNVTIFGDGAFKEITKLNEVTWAGPNLRCSKKREFGNTKRDTRDVHAQREDHVRIHQKVPVCKPTREALGETKSADTLILGF